MPIEVETPDGIAEFPDEMSPEEIQSVLRQHYQPEPQRGLTVPEGFATGDFGFEPQGQPIQLSPGARPQLAPPPEELALMAERDVQPSSAGMALTYAGNVARSIPADVAAGMGRYPEASGNIYAALTNQELPIDATIQAAAQEAKQRGEGSAVPTVAHISQGLAATAPLIAGVATLPRALQFLASAGFSVDMIRKAPELFNRYAEEINKPEAEQDPNAIAELQSGIIQTFAFAPPAGAHGVRGGTTAAKSISERLNLARETAAKNKEAQNAVQPQTETVLRNVREPEVTPEVQKPVPAEEAGAKTDEALKVAQDVAAETGFTLVEKPQAAAAQIPSPEQMARYTPEEQAMMKEILAKYPPEYEFTDQRPGSPTEGRTFRAPIGSDKATILESFKKSVPESEAKVGDPLGEASVAEPELAMAGPGSTIPADIGVSTSELTQLAKSTPKVSGTTKSDIGRSAGELLKGAASTAKSFAKNVKEFLVSTPKWDNYTEALGKWQGLRQESSRDAYMAWKDFKKQMPDQTRRAAIGAWADAGGDRVVMEKAAAELPAKYADVYKQALKLSPEEITFAKNIRNYFDKRLQDAQDAGILENGLENYIRRIYEKDPELAGAYSSELQHLSTATPNFARQRFFEYDADSIKAGKKPIQDFAARVLEYDQALNHAIADRAFVKAQMKLKMPDGRPRIDVGGSGKLLPEGDVPKEALLIKPQFKPNSDAPLDNRSDYRPFNHPAFRKYKWVSKDPAGRDVFVQGDVLVHPDAYPQMQKLLEASKIRQHPIGRGALQVSSTIKQTMLDLSLFHPVQIGVHGMEHRVNPLRLKEINLKEPTQKALVDHGLIIAEDRGFNDWSEGLHGTSLTRHIPGIGPKLQDFHNWMFKEWIPTIKMNMAEHALERNIKRYPKLSQDQVMRLTAEQANAAFGGLNYRMLGRSQTMQDFLRLTFLAPDFLEARGRFAGQAMKGFGREQMEALALGAATLYVTARIANQMINGNPHWEKENAFNIIYNDHAYGLRTVQGDLLHLMSKPGQFWYHRLNPTTTRPLMEVISGRDYFGRQVGIGDVLMDEVKTVVPISLRGLVEGNEQTVFESALNAMGITTRRYNAITQAYDLAKKWREKTNTRPEPGEFIYDPEKDPLRGLKTALQYEHTPDAVKEITDLVRSGAYTEAQLKQHFQRYASSLIAGSKKDQKAFLSSLRVDQQEIVKLAQERKEKTYEDFKAALELYRQQVKSAVPESQLTPNSPGLSR